MAQPMAVPWVGDPGAPSGADSQTLRPLIPGVIAVALLLVVGYLIKRLGLVR
jgi:hypothetical protein